MKLFLALAAAFTLAVSVLILGVVIARPETKKEEEDREAMFV